jgi:hypothetical protein
MPSYYLYVVSGVFAALLVLALAATFRAGRLAKAQARVARGFATCATTSIGPDRVIEVILSTPLGHWGVAAGLRRALNRIDDERYRFVDAAVGERTAIPPEIVAIYRDEATAEALATVADKYEDRNDAVQRVVQAVSGPLLMAAVCGLAWFCFILSTINH